MQNRYVGDIGDFAKFGLLRALCGDQVLGIAWYLYPDESHNQDGLHIDYLGEPDKWRHLDPELFDTLGEIVHRKPRNVSSLQNAGLFQKAIFDDRPLKFADDQHSPARLRAKWFYRLVSKMEQADIVFADPDNGLCEDAKYDPRKQIFWKRMPLSEAHVLCAGRPGIFYHHNSRFPGGHYAEIEHWLDLLGPSTLALYWRRFSNRTFFLTNPDPAMTRRVFQFVQRWSPHFELLENAKLNKNRVAVEVKAQERRQPPRKRDDQSRSVLSDRPGASKRCPECGHAFSGNGWGGIDAHWKAKHEHIMPYARAWPLIKAGKRPSSEDTD